MADMNVRDVFFDSLYSYVRAGEDIVIVSADLGAPSLDVFRRDFPHRFISVGIAEQNSIAIAGGLAMTGKISIAYGLNPFPVTRAYDQIRNIMASLRMPVTVAALKAGTCTAEAGFSHIAVENISLLRCLRNITIICPSDETISRLAVELIVSKPYPRYIQFDPFIVGSLYSDDEIDFKKGYVVSGAGDIAIVSNGIWAHQIKQDNPGVKLFDCFSLPLDKASFVSEISQCSRVLTVEDGVADGGLGSMILELFNDEGIKIPVKRMALRFEDGYSKLFTDRETIFEHEGLTMDAIKKVIEEWS